jgi:regulator of cell morphogenesis and NO signaling
MPSHTTQNFANADQSLGHLAVQIPGATAIFRKLKLDFCCGGQQTLANACAEKGLKTNQVLSEIQALEHHE